MPEAPVVTTNPITALDAKPGAYEIFLGLAALLCWAGAVAFGAMVPSAPYRNAIIATSTREMTISVMGDKPAAAGPVKSPPHAFDVSFHYTSVPAVVYDENGKPLPMEATASALKDAHANQEADSVLAKITQRPARSDLSGWAFCSSILLGALAFSATNLFLVSIFSAHLGAMAKRWNSAFAVAVDDPTNEVRRFYSTACLRGFLIYAVILSGSLVFGTERTFNDVAQGQYLKMAGLISSIAFLIGYEPRLFGRLMRNLEKVLDEPIGGIQDAVDRAKEDKKAPKLPNDPAGAALHDVEKPPAGAELGAQPLPHKEKAKIRPIGRPSPESRRR